MAVVSNWMAQARHLEAAGDLQAAAAVYQKALARQEETAGFADLSLHNGLGDLYLRAGKKKDALEAYESAAQHCEDQQLYANGIALCKKILRNAPDHAPAYRRAARLSALSGLEAEARLHYGRYRKHLEDDGRGGEALESLLEIVEITADEESTVELAEAWAGLGELERALELVRGVKARRQDEGRAVVILLRTIQGLQQGPEAAAESASASSPLPSTDVRPAGSAPEEVPAPESFAELDTSEFGYTLLPDAELAPLDSDPREPQATQPTAFPELEAVAKPEVAVELEAGVDSEAAVESEVAADAEAGVESEIAVEAEAVVESEPIVRSDDADAPVVAETEPGPRFRTILEELDDEFSDASDEFRGDPWEAGSPNDPSLGAFGAEPTSEPEEVHVPVVDVAPASLASSSAAAPNDGGEGSSDDPMALLLARLNVVMSEVGGDVCFGQALEVIDEMLTLAPDRFELLSRKLQYAFAIRDEPATVSAYLAIGEALDRHLDGFTVRTLSSSTGAGAVTAAIQVEDVPGVVPGN